MEITELQNMWSDIDYKISQNTRMNKEILRRMLVEKPQKRLQWIKLQSWFKLILPFILLPLFIITVEVRSDWAFITGGILFGSMIIVGYITEIIYLSKLQKLDFSQPIVFLNKEVAQLKKMKLIYTRMRYLLSPLAITGVLMMTFKGVGHIKQPESILMIVLILLVFTVSVVYTFRFAINRQFRKLNEEIAELELLEK
jgi:hypothetical protein